MYELASRGTSHWDLFDHEGNFVIVARADRGRSAVRDLSVETGKEAGAVKAESADFLMVRRGTAGAVAEASQECWASCLSPTY